MSEADVRELNPAEAAVLLDRDPRAALIDVRSRVEFDFVGHPVGALHVPWKEFPDWAENPEFVLHVEAALQGRARKDTPLLCICRSGTRSMAAAKALAAAGYRAVYNVAEGFEGDIDENLHRGTINGWRLRGLPWEQT